MPEVCIAVSRLMVRWDIGWPLRPFGKVRGGNHRFDYEADLNGWPWWRVRLVLVPMNRDRPGAAPAWRLCAYSRKGCRCIDAYWRPARFWWRAHVQLPRGGGYGMG